ncbi:MAG: methyltransferase domain-containing protein [Candidatus Buchananbacteria bacterium]
MLDKKFWKKYFKSYDVLNVLIPYQQLLDKLIESLDIKKGDLVLDAGAGTGNLSVKLVEKGAKVTALDSIQEGLDMIKIKNSDIKIVKNDLSEPLPFSDNYFDKIVLNNVAYTLSPERRKLIFDEFFRILKPKGKIVVSDVIEGWNPTVIYTNHLSKEFEIIGLWKTLAKVLALIIPTLKIFYYNSKIKKEEVTGNSMKENEHIDLLKDSGFGSISDNLMVYANQAVLNSAIKEL